MKILKEVEEVIAFGHNLIKSTHKTTFEITKEHYLTERGDCIVAVGANKAARDLSDKFKEIARKPNAKIIVIIEAAGEKEIVNAFGSPNLMFTHPTDIVIRKSNYICSRTIAIKANKAAYDFSRSLIEKLRNPKQKVKITLIAEV